MENGICAPVINYNINEWNRTVYLDTFTFYLRSKFS